MTTILLAGDSLAVGLTSPMRKLAEARGLKFVADATSGTTARQWVLSSRLVGDVQDHRPDIILISLGTNDARGNTTWFANDVASLIGAAGGASVRWIGPPEMPFDMSGVRSALGASGVAVFPSETFSYQRAPDGIHMPPNGYAAWAQDIADGGYLDKAGPSSVKKWVVGGVAVLAVAYALWWLD